MRRFSSFLGIATLLATVFAGPAMADDAGFKTKQAGQFLVRLRAVGVLPEDGNSINSPAGATGLNARVDDNFIPEADLSYFITDNIAVEAIAGVTQHRVKTGGAANVKLGDVWLLPPTITAQYHFFTKERISPYIGAGLNYTFLFGQSGSAIQPISYSNAFGPAVQAGIDIALTGNWSLNIDVKKLFISTDVKVGTAPLKTTVDLNPWLVGVGVGYRF